MKQTKIIMGMPITLEVVGLKDRQLMKKIFDYFKQVDERFSPYKPTSELSQVNNGLSQAKYSSQMKEVLQLCEETKQLTQGFFDIKKDNQLDPSGLVKGWAVYNAAQMLKANGQANFYVEAGGDIQVEGSPASDASWTIGIRNPFKIDEIVKVLKVRGKGIATSGTYIRGQHIYNPKAGFTRPKGIVSLTVIGPNIFEADRFATAAFAMGDSGLSFINALPGFEAYQINEVGQATFTEGFEAYVA